MYFLRILTRAFRFHIRQTNEKRKLSNRACDEEHIQRDRNIFKHELVPKHAIKILVMLDKREYLKAR